VAFARYERMDFNREIILTKTTNTMKTLFKIIYTIVALSPIFALGYMLGMKLLEK